MTTREEASGAPLGIDGYNVLITIESALSGGLVLVGRDGCYRDLASVHGTYRKVEETVPAVALIVDVLCGMGIPHVDWYLDRPVANSGRLRALIGDVLQARGGRATGVGSWNIELISSPDAALANYPHIIAASDSAVLDRCAAWLNLAALVNEARVPNAGKVELSSGTVEP